MAEHACTSYLEWLQNNHFFCSCGHVEWAHYSNGQCAHCYCKRYNGEPRPKTEYELHKEDTQCGIK